MNVRDHLCIGRRLLQSATIFVGAVLPTMTVGIVALLVMRYAMERGAGLDLPHGWRDFIPESWDTGAVIAIAVVTAASFAFVMCRKHPTAANVAEAVGIAAALVVTYATQWCDSVGGVTAGLTAAGITVALATVVNSQAGKLRRNIATDSGGLIAQTNTKPDEAYIGVVPSVQIALALIMALVAYLAITDEDLSGSRTKLLAFAGIGITAASSISSKLNLKTTLAAAAAVISVIGAYIEVDQALIESNSEVGISTMLIAAGIVTGVLIMGLAFLSHITVRIFIAPLLAGVVAASIASVAALIPAVFISAGCNLPATWGAASILVAIVAGLIVGFGTLVGTAAIAIHSWRTTRSPGPPLADANPENPLIP